MVMDWLFGRRPTDPPGPPPPGAPGTPGAAGVAGAGPSGEPDSPAALARELVVVNRLVNASAGQLPTSATVTARRVTDTVDAVLLSTLDSGGGRELDIHARVSLNGILRDYLPTTVRRYLALDPATRTAPRPTGQTAADALAEQLDFLLDAATEVLDAVRHNDANALMAQGNFLRSKFAGSELDF